MDLQELTDIELIDMLKAIRLEVERRKELYEQSNESPSQRANQEQS